MKEDSAEQDTEVQDTEVQDTKEHEIDVDDWSSSSREIPHSAIDPPLHETFTLQDLKNIGLYIYSFVTVSLVSGVVYGWPSLRRELQQEGTSLDEATLGVIYTVGSWAAQGCRFFYGVSRDSCLGTKVTCCISLLSVLIGMLGIAFAGVDNSAALAIFMFFVGMGSGTQLCLQPVAGIFSPKIQGALISSTSGAFQISGLIFVALTAGSAGRKVSFTVFAAVVLCLFILALVILPKGQFSVYEEVQQTSSGKHGTPLEDNIVGHSRHASALSSQHESNDSEVVDCVDASAACRQPETNSAGQKPSLRAQLFSSEYILLIIWFSILLIPLQYYIGTIGFQLELNGDTDGFYTRLFSIIYASVAVLAPFLGKIADNCGLGVAQGIATTLCGVSLLLLSLDSISLQAQAALGMSSYSIGRMMVFGSFFTNVGKRFGYGNYGTLSGVGLLLSALASLLQYPLITSSVSRGHDKAVNLACGLGILCTLPYCYWLAVVERQRKVSI